MSAASEILGQGDRCANCADVLRGEFCARCGQHARDLRRPAWQLLWEVLGEVFSVDARLARTLRPLLLAPGEVTRQFLAGHRVAHVSPLKTYLTAALLFFGLFSLFPSRVPVRVVVAGSPEAAASRGEGGSRVSFELPRHSPVFDRAFQAASARARANPEAFAAAWYATVPRTVFFFLPIFALLLELFYRKEGYYLDHLVFSLYYHAFVFANLVLVFVIARAGPYAPRLLIVPLLLALVLWVPVHLFMALRRVYGGSRWKTAGKLAGLGVLYLASFVLIGMPVMVGAALMFF